MNNAFTIAKRGKATVITQDGVELTRGGRVALKRQALELARKNRRALFNEKLGGSVVLVADFRQ